MYIILVLNNEDKLMKKYFDSMINDFDFENREGQIEMAKIIKKHLEDNTPCIIEAGTGIGKTLAYLLPLVLYAKENDTRVVISTNTINLQEQLVEVTIFVVIDIIKIIRTQKLLNGLKIHIQVIEQK